ncbi:sulfite exporter TauE/SafE family protein [Thioalkalivibrio paradoxus]|uniref:Urease accessory protein UreH-like transmembrane domain-containing protein n=1 Tax=Thioalkalivibrio paradoxus ARh 1 TaxID=713585 RepID=W0DKU4_9GAMM|nr:sulfite exporter TauE/SafE family protein [Thioalkalivibrio paradoxus]AHE99081.1 hypothetical protein THITH_13365 [Thioalkalivibrio paradoxus ARh 1]
MEHSIAIAFLIGLASTLHCVGMCGGISGALTLSLPEDVRKRRTRLFTFVLAYGLGRIGSYALAGGIAGVVGAILLRGGGDTGALHLIAQLFAATILAGIGLYLAGWFPGFAQLERLGAPAWRRIEPWGRRLLPVSSPLQALLFGAAWGWLPCGLVYSMLIWTLATADALQGALLMLAFGAGTLPGVMAAGIFAAWLVRLARAPHLRQAIGLLIVIVALATIVYSLTGSVNHH